MRKSLFILGIVVIALVLSGNRILNDSAKDINAKIYYVDHSMLRLIPIDYKIKNTTPKRAASKVIKTLIEGKDNNRKILRVIPDIDNCIGVNVRDKTAVVNLKKEFLDNLSPNRNHELLCLYSIVNSLTSIEGIDCVNFLIDGKVKQEYIAGIDMRETFIPDYYM